MKLELVDRVTGAYIATLEGPVPETNSIIIVGGKSWRARRTKLIGNFYSTCQVRVESVNEEIV